MDKVLENNKIVINNNGTIRECKILFTFTSPDTLKAYVGYSDESIASNGRHNIFVSSYDPFSKYPRLSDITDKRELDMINNVLEEIDYSTNN